MISVSVPDELYEQLQKLAGDMQQTVEQCHVWALEDFIAEERVETDALLAGLRDVEAGRVIPHEAVAAWLASLGTDHPLPMPTSAGASERLAS